MNVQYRREVWTGPTAAVDLFERIRKEMDSETREHKN
jgi:hypothetical protein